MVLLKQGSIVNNAEYLEVTSTPLESILTIDVLYVLFSNVDFELQIDWSEEELAKLNGESVFKLELFPSKNNENILIKGKIVEIE